MSGAKAIIEKCVLVLFVGFILLTSCAASASQPTQEKSTLIEELSKTLGFCMGQRFTLERIKKTFPDLALSAQKAILEFKASFGAAEENVKNALQDILKKRYSEYTIQMKKQMGTILSSQQLNRQDAVEFISEVESRAKGQIPSPVLETLLAYRFIDNPSEEILRGHTRVFRTKDHPKAKGCDIQIAYPASWRAKEGERPNIIQKFISQNGHGLEVVMLMVKDLPIPISQKELDELFSEKDFSEKQLSEMMPEGAKFISTKPIVLDNHKGIMLIFDQTLKRIDITTKMRGVHFITISKNKMIFLQCMVSTPSGKETELQERFTRFEPLFKLIANGFILQNQYK
jgi:hypothetical protein